MRVRLKTQRLHELLAASGRSQNAWAIRVGLSRGHWSDLVNGKHPHPSPKTRDQMLDAFDVPFEELFEIESTAPEADPALQGALSERYVVDRQIGAGAMGVVYRARDLHFGRQVAIKTVFPEAVGGLGERFVAEVRRTAQLQHPNILPLFDAGGAGEQPYYVMPLVEDGSLRDRLERDGAMTLQRALPIVRDMAAALEHAHSHGVLHCDVKPENVLLTGDHAYVADFGLSRAVHLDAVREWERPPEVDIGAGTPAYVSPEQARARIDLDRRSDVYSLACVLFEMLAGEAPFGGGSTTEIVKRRFDAVPPDLRRLAPTVPAAVASVIAAAMALDPDDRPATVADFVNQLELVAATTGPSPPDTRRAAHSALNAVAAWAVTRQSLPRTRFMRNFIDDLRYSLRSLRRRPMFAVVAILTLALGIGANAAIFSVINAVVLRPLPYPDADRLIRIYSQFEGNTCCPISTPNFLEIKEQATQIEAMVAYTNNMFAVSGDGDPVRLPGLIVSAGFFEIFGGGAQVGRLIGTEEDTFGSGNAVVISDRLWRERFGADPGVIGESMTIDTEPYTIIGVTQPGFREDSPQALYLPFQWDPDNLPSRNRNWHGNIAKLAPDATLESALAELNSIYGGIVAAYPDEISNKGVDARPYSQVVVGDSQRRPLYMLWGAVGMVLLVACANVVNLMLARAESRQRELAVRSALGASRLRILAHFMTESLVVSLAGGVAGVAAAYAGLQLLLSNFGGSIPRSATISVDGAVLGFTLGVSVLTGLVVGALPVFWQRRGDVSATLTESTRSEVGGQRRLRQALVVVEVALALMLVIGAGLMLKSFWRLSQVEMGVDASRFVTARVALPAARYPENVDRFNFYSALRERVQALPAVERVGLSTAAPFSNTYSNFSEVYPADNPDLTASFVEARVVDDGYFETIGLPLVMGRNFNAADNADAPPVAVVNRELARQLFDDRNPVGERIVPGPNSDGWEIVGVVEDMLDHGPDRRVPPTMYYPMIQNGGWVGSLALVVRAEGDPLELAPDIRRIVTEQDPDLPVFGVDRLDQLIAGGLGSRRFTMSLLAAFAGVALLLGAIGIYGVMAYNVEQRTREIGLRQALGANHAKVLGMVVGQGLRVALVGVGIGTAGAYYLRQSLASQLFEVDAFDPGTYAAVSPLLLLIAAVACFVPARRAAAVDPMEALRED